MRKTVLIVCFVMIFLLSGCKDITGSFKPGSFGKTPQETAMLEAIKEKYGDLTQAGEPRFLEAMMTTIVENFIPVDSVTKYSKDAQKLYVWFVYDNFNEDQLEIEWIYLDNNYSIHTFKSTTGKDFGRGSFILERPDDGWALGKYNVVIRGRGIQEIVSFEIIEGATVSMPLPFINGKITLPANPGWYMTRWEYIISPSDVTVVEGGSIASTMMGTSSKLYDYYVGQGEKNNFSQSVTRKAQDGKVLHSGSVNTTWTDPPEYIQAGNKPSFYLNRSSESTWGVGNFSATFDMDDIKPGYGTQGKINFVASDGNGYIQQYEGVFEAARPMPVGKQGDKRAIILSLSNSYGYKYYYEWRE